MPFTDLRKTLKTPEFVENNGGWVVFSFLIVVPALVVIFGLIEPASDWFLSLLSIDKQNHVSAPWELKYLLFFVFIFFVPVSLYLLVSRPNPAKLKRKAEKAYNVISKEVRRIYSQMYGPSPNARHNLEKLSFVYRVDAKYSLDCEGEIGLLAKEDLHFWKYGVGAEAEGEGQEAIADIDFKVDIPGQSAAFLPLKDTMHEKEVMIAFLPYVKQGDRCEVKLKWTWHKCMGQLRDKGEEEYGWTCESLDPDCKGHFRLEYVFDSKLGDIECRNVDLEPKGAVLRKDVSRSATTWIFEAPDAPLGKGKQYRLIFERR